MTVTIFVGDIDSSLADVAKNYTSTAFLIDHRNYETFLSTEYVTDVTVYTSFSDLPKIDSANSVFFDILTKADYIFYCPPVKWSDHSDSFRWSGNQTITEYFLYHIQLIKNNVQGLDLASYQSSNYLDLVEGRKVDNKQLWIVGCSVFHGFGVDSDSKFGILVSQNLDLNVSHLTKVGSSIEWAKDQILRSDIKANDIVVWGLTHEVRAPRVIDHMVTRESNPDILLDETSLYRAVTSVYQVVNFCKKITARLIIMPILCSEQLQLLIQHLDDYHQLPYRKNFLDIGTDNIHPGPIQHQEWANICTKLLKEKI